MNLTNNNKTILILAIILILINATNMYIIQQQKVEEKPTGQASGTVSLFVWPSCSETTHTADVTTVGKSASIDATSETINATFDITTTSDVTDETLYAARCDSDINSGSVSGKSVLKTYFTAGSSTLDSSLDELTIRVYYLDSWLASKGLTESTLTSYKWDGSSWTEAGSVNTTNNYAEATLSSFTEVGLFAEEEPEEAEAAPSGPGGGGGGPSTEEVEEPEKSFVAKEIIEPIKKTVSKAAKKIAKVAAPVTKRYWPVILIATLLMVGIGVWVERRRRKAKE